MARIAWDTGRQAKSNTEAALLGSAHTLKKVLSIPV